MLRERPGGQHPARAAIPKGESCASWSPATTAPSLAADGARREGLLPIGLASFGRLTRAVRKDEPIPADAITFEEENVVLDLRRRQDTHVAGQRSR